MHTIPQVMELKERANAIFKLGRYEHALGLYQEAIRLACAEVESGAAGCEPELLAVIHSNSAECLLQLGRWRAAVESSESALRLLPEHTKSRARLDRERCVASFKTARRMQAAQGLTARW